MMTLNHGFSGYVCSRAVLPLLRPLLRRITPLPERSLAWACFFGAMLPDLDAVTTLAGSGYYFSGDWYGHRQASHSLLGTLVLALLAALPLALRHTRGGVMGFRAAFFPLTAAFWAGGLLHLLGDVVTPRRPLPLFWPLEGEIGAFAHIGWFSPYLLWMFLGALAVEGALRVARIRSVSWPRWRDATIWGVHALVAARWIDYLIRSRYESPEQWSAYQHSLLPAALVNAPTEAMSLAWHWMTR